MQTDNLTPTEYVSTLKGLEKLPNALPRKALLQFMKVRAEMPFSTVDPTMLSHTRVAIKRWSMFERASSWAEVFDAMEIPDVQAGDKDIPPIDMYYSTLVYAHYMHKVVPRVMERMRTMDQA